MKKNNDIDSSERSQPDVRLEFERFLADLSARLVALPPERIDDEIRNALKEVLKFFQIDHFNLLRLLPGKTHFMVTHNADADGIPPFPIGTPRPVSLYPWTVKTLSEDNEVFSFARLEEMPEAAATDRQNFGKHGIRSGSWIPIVALRSSEYSLSVFSTCNDRNCLEEDIPRLRLLGELFVNALERSKAELALRESEARLRERLEEIERLKLQLEKENIYLREAGRPSPRTNR